MLDLHPVHPFSHKVEAFHRYTHLQLIFDGPGTLANERSCCRIDIYETKLDMLEIRLVV